MPPQEEKAKGRVPQVVEVTLPLKIPKTLSYLTPFKPVLGARLLVTLKGKPKIGIVTGLEGEAYPYLRQAQEPIDYAPILPPKTLSFYRWVSRYHLAPLGEVVKYALPPSLFAVPKKAPLPSFKGPLATEGQGKGFVPQLWHEEDMAKRLAAYQEEISQVMSEGKQVLLLLPEQEQVQELGQLWEGVFSPLLLYHGRLSPKKRREIWFQILSSESCLVIGTRTAVFLPFQRLGLIIVEHEEDQAFKEERGFRYQARDLALVRGKLDEAKVILGSCAPSVKSYYWAQRGKYVLREGRPLFPPRLDVVDLAQEKKGLLSQRLINACRTVLAHEGQVFLFLNRLGYAPVLQCPDCGYVWYCPRCQSTLKYHKEEGKLQCHLCSYSLPAPPLCPVCQGEGVTYLGTGTERLQEIVQRIFPQARVARYDHETAKQKLDLTQVQILIGTRKVGFRPPLPRLKLIGIVLADQSLCLPDYQSAEKTYQVLKKLCLNRVERIIIQTFHPQHHVFRGLQEGYQAFFQRELALRQLSRYPPFSRLAKLEWESSSQEKASSAAERAYEFLRAFELELLGPREEKKRGRYVFSLLLRGNFASLYEALKAYQEKFFPLKGLKFHLDWDPVF